MSPRHLGGGGKWAVKRTHPRFRGETGVTDAPLGVSRVGEDRT